MSDLVSRYQFKLRAFFSRRARNRWDAEELVQEVFCKIIKRGSVDLSEYNDSYMYTIAWSVLRDRIRRDKVRHEEKHVSYDETFAKEDTVSPEKVHSGSELYECFVKALNGLSPRCRDIFMLSRYEDFSYLEISTHLNISVSAVEKQMMVALRKFRQVL